MPDYPVAKVISDFPSLRLIELDSNGNDMNDTEWQMELSGLEFKSKEIYLNSHIEKDYSTKEIGNEERISIELKPENWFWATRNFLPLSFFGSEEEINSAMLIIHSKELSKGFLEHSEVFGWEEDGLTFNIHLGEKEINSLKNSILHTSYSHIEFKVGLDGIYTDGIEVQRELKVLGREDEVTDSEGIKLPKLSKIEYFDIQVVNKVESNEFD